MVSFLLKAEEKRNKFVSNIRGVAFAPLWEILELLFLILLAVLIDTYQPEARNALGISEGFFRISVGLEDANELIEEFRKALDRQ